MDSVKRVVEFNPGFLACIDYLLAAANYEEFVYLMFDFRQDSEVEYDEELPAVDEAA